MKYYRDLLEMEDVSYQLKKVAARELKEAVGESSRDKRTKVKKRLAIIQTLLI